MLPRELIRRIRRLEIATRQVVSALLAGQYHSVFKGRGMAFSEVRPYQAGDDIRSIDWNVTARTSAPHVKVFTEERELTVVLLVDVSASEEFGSRGRASQRWRPRSPRRSPSRPSQTTTRWGCCCSATGSRR